MECVCIRKIFELYLDILSAVQKRHVYFFQIMYKRYIGKIKIDLRFDYERFSPASHLWFKSLVFYIS